jgi:hypothetical protein
LIQNVGCHHYTFHQQDEQRTRTTHYRKEAQEAIEEMATRKAPRLDGIALEFFMKIWLIIRQEYMH